MSEETGRNTLPTAQAGPQVGLPAPPPHLQDLTPQNQDFLTASASSPAPPAPLPEPPDVTSLLRIIWVPSTL